MRAVWIRRYGRTDVLEVRETEDPVAGPGEVRVRIRAAGLNFAEVSARQGLYPAAPKPPCVVGYEGAGEVDQVGEGVSGLSTGDRVLFIRRFGAHADVATVPAGQVVPIPAAMSFEDAAALPVNYLTADHMLFNIRRIRSGDRVLIHAAAGGVGTAVLQLCRTVEGVTTFGTASAGKHDYVREHGCDHPIDYRTTDYVEAVRELTDGEGVDLVCDALGGADWRKGYSLLAPAGVLACFGFANAQTPGRRNLLRVAGKFLQVPTFKPLRLMGENRVVAGVDLGSMWEHQRLIHDGLQRIVGYWTRGQIRPHVDLVAPFSRAAEAHAHLEERRNRGKVLLVPDPE